MNIETPFDVIEKYQMSPPVNIDGIARDIGIRIFRERLGDGIYGKLTRDKVKGGPSGYAIYVNSLNAPVRQRFTIAHEIAHFILHRDLFFMEVVDRELYRSDLSSAYETQANQLAAEILLPKGRVQTEYEALSNMSGPARTAKLARLFDVSQAAMEIRLKDITRSKS